MTDVITKAAPLGRFLVAEVSKTWANGQSRSPLYLAQMFEQAIEYNLNRGYLLHSFQLHQVFIPGVSSQVSDDDQFVETIIAVFERVEPWHGAEQPTHP